MATWLNSLLLRISFVESKILCFKIMGPSFKRVITIKPCKEICEKRTENWKLLSINSVDAWTLETSNRILN